MAAQPRIDRHTFLAYLRQSGLVGDAQLEEVLPQLPDSNRGRALARALVERGVLTRFQAERLLAGRTAGFFLGQYRILEQIGRGGTSRVFSAEHRTLKRVVALKVLAPELFKTERAVDLFLHEVHAAAPLVHPNIVTAYDAGEVNGRYYLVLELVDGPNLAELVRTQGPLPVGLACDYVRQAANGLQCAHALGMVHRDIKPSNLLVQLQRTKAGVPGDAPGLVKVSDFGLARLHVPVNDHPLSPRPRTILTKENTVMGTPDYLSPEQSRDLHKTDIRSDLYSLGCTFYFLLTGKVPYPGGNALDKLIRHSTERPAPISDVRSDVPSAVVAIVEKLMAKHPADRYQTPAELAEALAPYAVSGPTPWAPPRLATLGRDLAATPLPLNVGLEVDEEDVGPSSSGEMSALAVPVINDVSRAPRSGPAPSRKTRTLPRKPERFRRRWGWAVAAAVFILAALAGAAVAVAHFLE
jgi:serine/threonine-protein kinase